MSACKMSRDDWAAFLSGEPEETRRIRMAEHLDNCPSCRAEADGMARVLENAEAVKAEIHEAVASVNWDALPAVIADRVLAETRWPAPSGAARRIRPRGFAFRLRPALAGLAAGLAVGATAMYLAMRSPVTRPEGGPGYFASREFLDRAELEMARRNTLDYLEKSQYVLFDVFESTEKGGAGRAALSPERTRDILSKKKYLNAQLDRFQMAQAKAICDQIEMLFLELAQVSEGLPEAELLKIRELVEERQLFLKINLVKKELESEI